MVQQTQEEITSKRTRVLKSHQLSENILASSQNSHSSKSHSEYEQSPVSVSLVRQESDLSIPPEKSDPCVLFEHLQKLLCCNDISNIVKTQILTLMPPDWSRYKIIGYFPALNWRMIEKANRLLNNKGILGIPDAKKGKYSHFPQLNLME